MELLQVSCSRLSLSWLTFHDMRLIVAMKFQLLRYQVQNKKQFGAVKDSSFKLDCVCVVYLGVTTEEKLMKLVIFQSHGLLQSYPQLIFLVNFPQGTSTI